MKISDFKTHGTLIFAQVVDETREAREMNLKAVTDVLDQRTGTLRGDVIARREGGQMNAGEIRFLNALERWMDAKIKAAMQPAAKIES